MNIDHKHARRNSLAAVFCFYHEAGVALFCVLVALVELAASLFMESENFYIDLVQQVAAFFAVVGLLLALYVLRDARKHGMLTSRPLSSDETCMAITSVIFCVTSIYFVWLAKTC